MFFLLKKNDKIEEITQVLNNFYVAAGGASVMKKRKQPQQKKQQPIGEKKKPKQNKEIIVEDENEDENECEKLEINETAMIELCYYYEKAGLSLRNCILSFND